MDDKKGGEKLVVSFDDTIGSLFDRYEPFSNLDKVQNLSALPIVIIYNKAIKIVIDLSQKLTSRR